MELRDWSLSVGSRARPRLPEPQKTALTYPKNGRSVATRVGSFQAVRFKIPGETDRPGAILKFWRTRGTKLQNHEKYDELPEF